MTGMFDYGKDGGAGGFGGQGGTGGAGGTGAKASEGGGGGGAIEIRALGRLIIEGEVLAAGGDGQAAIAGSPGGAGALGLSGATGGWAEEPWSEMFTPPAVPLGLGGGPGADGGTAVWNVQYNSYMNPVAANGGGGAGGGAGGAGGAGGNSGSGGGGAGGTIMLTGSAVQSAGATVDCHAGNVGAGCGRLVLRTNTAQGFDGTLVDAWFEAYDGPRGPNPFIHTGLGTVESPLIPDLRGGAEAFGVFDSLTADMLIAQGLLADRPAGACAALLRMDLGPAGHDDDYGGFDMLLLANLSGEALLGPSLGCDTSGAQPDFLWGLLEGGRVDDPDWLNFAAVTAGPEPLLALGPDEVYATLVPEGVEAFSTSFLLDGESWGCSGEALAHGGAAYVVPEPATLALLALGGLALLTGRRRT